MQPHQKPNLQKELDDVLRRLTDQKTTPSLLLHSCCAPCSSYVLEYLTRYFRITLLYDNPNIAPRQEHDRRLAEQRTLLDALTLPYPVALLEGAYEPEAFDRLARGREEEPEGGARCAACYALRLQRTAKAAAEGGFDYFTTTLSISPHKDAAVLDNIGRRLADEYGVAYLPADFKKRGGYRRSVELSAQYGLYRQDYCGCEFSRRQARQRRQAAKTPAQ
ncbi:MAG: epoxyqueuosine reductase QueH [Eubacteriales bacterium]|nr:epoxyqueuosine reductase QueH [Eubacteriales bacterium]